MVHPGYLLKQLTTGHFNDFLREQIAGANINNLSGALLYRFQIPLPPLEVQKEIVAEIEGYQKVIDGARAVLDNYRPHIAIQPDWPIVEVGELAKPQYGFTASAADEGDARFIRITDIAPDGSLRPDDAKFITLTDETRQSQLSKGDILVARTGATYGKTMLFEEDYAAVFASYLIRLQFLRDRVHPRYYWVFAQSDNYWSQANAMMTGGGQPQFNGNALKQVKVPLPPLTTQQAIVAEIEAEQALVAANEDPGHSRPRVGRRRAGPGGGVSHGRSLRARQLPSRAWAARSTHTAPSSTRCFSPHQPRRLTRNTSLHACPPPRRRTRIPTATSGPPSVISGSVQRGLFAIRPGTDRTTRVTPVRQDDGRTLLGWARNRRMEDGRKRRRQQR